MVRLVATGTEALAVVAACEQVAAWLVREVKEASIAPPSRPEAVREAERRILERRILTAPPALQGYWTARALMVADGPVAWEKLRPLTIIRRSEALAVPRPWRFAALAGGLTGLTLGGCLALTVTWWREQVW